MNTDATPNAGVTDEGSEESVGADAKRGVGFRHECIDRAAFRKLREEANDAFENCDFSGAHFVEVDAKRVRFENCNFQGCTFDRAYAHQATFRHCRFHGAKFNQSNLRSATIETCDFDFTQFDRTIICSRTVMGNPPVGKPNVKREIARELKVNAYSVGDGRAARACFYEEMRQEREHYRNAFWSSDEFYRTKYVGLRRLQAGMKFARCKVSEFTWMHGTSPWRVLRLGGILLLLHIVVGFASSPIPTGDAMPTGDGTVDELSLVHRLWSAILLSVAIVFGIQGPLELTYAHIGFALQLTGTALGYAIFAVAIASFVRRYSRD